MITLWSAGERLLEEILRLSTDNRLMLCEMCRTSQFENQMFMGCSAHLYTLASCKNREQLVFQYIPLGVMPPP
jgi:hypothetical protein